jgi:hypothetical protein
MKRGIILSGIFVMLSLSGFAQKNTAKTKKTIKAQVTSTSTKKEVKDTIALKNTIKIITSINEQSVKLRWALTSPIGWKACNEYGFRVERYTLRRDTSWLPTPELMVIADPYKARPVEEWETLAKKDDYAAIMAQALYGKDMQVDIADKSPLTQIVNETQDLQQRYTLSMLACDMSFDAAQLAAWGYEDKTVKKNERYFYRVIPLAPLSKVQLDSAFVVVKMEDYKKLPVPGKPDVLFSDSMATIGYNYFFLKDTYLAFHVERSIDGKTFEQLTKTPVTAMNIKKGQESYQFYYSDKLKDNNTTYYYRIKGMTSFSDIGPVSPIVKGKGISKNNAFPHITYCLLNEKDQGEIEWEFDAVNESKIKGFEISHSQRNEGPYKVLQTITDVKARKTVIKKLENSNYFTVTALGKNGEKNTSPKRFLQLNDSIPPAPPEVISATVDSTGKVKLEWKANTEKDFKAYKVFRANHLKEEPAMLTDTMYYKTVYEDQLDPSMINRKIYYYIIAVDKRYNQSAFSKAAEIIRPDVTPPTSPIFKSYTISDKGVFLQWAGCRDEDVAKHVLLRREATKNAVWVSVAQFKDTTSSYVDQTAEAGRTYYYSIIAKDNSGLESLPMKSLKLSLPSDPAIVKVESFKAIPNLDGNQIEIQWQTDRTDIDHFDLYKGEEDEPTTLWKVLDSKQRSINDSIKLNHKYHYMIRIVLKSGSTGAFSKINL